MAKMNLKKRIGEGLLILDGAMGTELMARGIEAGKCYDYQNIESPRIVFDIHRAYLLAGSDAIITNTFGASKFALARHGFGDKVEEINTAAAKIARRVAGDDNYVLGDIGPCGDFLEPLGTVKPDELKDAFALQAQALLAGGVDGFIIESMSALEEILIAIEAVKSVCTLPVFASMAFESTKNGFRTVMGVDVETAVSKITSPGVDALGFNCGKMSLDNYIKLANQFVSIAEGLDVAVLAEPNAGLPQLVEDAIVYNVLPEDFAEAAEKIHSAGVNIIGSCCGSRPEHIEAVAKRLKNR